MMILPVLLLFAHVAEEVVHPAHVPLKREAEAVLVQIAGHAGPRRGLLRDHDRAGREPADHRIHVLQEADRLEVMVSAVLVRDPLSVLLSVVQVEHGRDRVHAQAVGVESVQPVERVRDQEVLHFVPAVVKDQGAPLRVLALARVRMLVEGQAVELLEAVGVLREMRRHPVQDHADPVPVAQIHEIHEAGGVAEAAGRREIPGDLVAPGLVQRVLHHRQQLDVVEAFLLHILHEPIRDVAVAHEVSVGLPHPAAEVDFVDVHGRGDLIFEARAVHPGFVLPLVVADVPDARGGAGAHLGPFPVRVSLIDQCPGLRQDLEFITVAVREAGDEDLPNAVVQAAHAVAAAVPAVKVADHAHADGVRGPDAEQHAGHAVHGHRVRAELLIDLIVEPLPEQVDVHVGDAGREGVGVVRGPAGAVRVLGLEPIAERGRGVCCLAGFRVRHGPSRGLPGLRRDHGFVKAGSVDLIHVEAGRLSVLRLQKHGQCRGLRVQRAHSHARILRVRSEDRVRVAMPAFDERSDLFETQCHTTLSFRAVTHCSNMIITEKPRFRKKTAAFCIALICASCAAALTRLPPAAPPRRPSPSAGPVGP